MKKLARVITLMMLSLFAVSVVLSSVYADPVEKADGFNCPVLGGKAGQNGVHQGISPIAGGYYTHGGPDVSVPTHVPNEGYPSVEGSFLIPGEVGYSAIWDRANAP
ncbi:MAG: hypothetical protein P8Y18_10135 [Candidatus Bathyarchaeota archaeon]